MSGYDDYHVRIFEQELEDSDVVIVVAENALDIEEFEFYIVITATETDAQTA